MSLTKKSQEAFLRENKAIMGSDLKLTSAKNIAKEALTVSDLIEILNRVDDKTLPVKLEVFNKDMIVRDGLLLNHGNAEIQSSAAVPGFKYFTLEASEINDYEEFREEMGYN